MYTTVVQTNQNLSPSYLCLPSLRMQRRCALAVSVGGELATWGIKMSESEEHLSAACRMGQTFNPTHHGLTGLNVDCDWMLAVSID